MSATHETIALPNNYKLEVVYDQDAQNPRLADNLGCMVLFERNWIQLDTPEKQLQYGFNGNSIEDFINHVCGYELETSEMFRSGPRKGLYKTEKVKGNNNGLILLGFDIYSHSGVCLINIQVIDTKQKTDALRENMEQFSGFLFVTPEQLKEEGNINPVELLKAELTDFDNYLQGLVFGGIVSDPNGEEVESIYGYSGLESIADLQLYAETVVENDLAALNNRTTDKVVNAINELSPEQKERVVSIMQNEIRKYQNDLFGKSKTTKVPFKQRINEVFKQKARETASIK